jgi:aerobic-type carbon monoxide dehydrogenase small subunit (CoxS/CutS family)
MEASQDVVVFVNGKRYVVPNQDPTTKLITFLRNNSTANHSDQTHETGFKSPKHACDRGVCGAWSVKTLLR